ncbi:hypothetical protein EMIT048CA2_50094 [Pseudomonas chlororaphis]
MGGHIAAASVPADALLSASGRTRSCDRSRDPPGCDRVAAVPGQAAGPWLVVRGRSCRLAAQYPGLQFGRWANRLACACAPASAATLSSPVSHDGCVIARSHDAKPLVKRASRIPDQSKLGQHGTSHSPRATRSSGVVSICDTHKRDWGLRNIDVSEGRRMKTHF